jgi:hypothetical protein
MKRSLMTAVAVCALTAGCATMGSSGASDGAWERAFADNAADNVSARLEAGAAAGPDTQTGCAYAGGMEPAYADDAESAVAFVAEAEKCLAALSEEAARI